MVPAPRILLVLNLIHCVQSYKSHYTVFDDFAYPTRTLKNAENNSLYRKLQFDCQRKNKVKCRDDEAYRMEMNRLQPEAMRNFTQIGFDLVPAPKDVFEQIQSLWKENRHRAQIEWNEPTIFHNHIDSPTRYLSLEEEDPTLAAHLVKNVRDVLEEWTDQHLRPTSLYGMREYSEGALLAPHVDRFPLIVSAIVSIDQE